MKTERELFLKYMRSIGSANFMFELDDEGNFDDMSMAYSWSAWQASASREGYKLVPVEKLEELKRDADRMISSAHLYQDECHIKSFGRLFFHNYKDIMGDVG